MALDHMTLLKLLETYNVYAIITWSYELTMPTDESTAVRGTSPGLNARWRHEVAIFLY